jgi:hypothetical protein
LQNRTASHHETVSTGNWSPCAVLGRWPVACAYRAWLIGNAASWYGASFTDQLRWVRRSDSVTCPGGIAISSLPALASMASELDVVIE